jgi:hypothetical protein
VLFSIRGDPTTLPSAEPQQRMPHQSATADYALTELPHLGADSATYAVGHLVSAQPGPHLTDLFRSGLLEDIKSEPSGHGSPDNQVVLPRDEGLAVFAAEHPRLFAPQNVPERESHEESYGTCLSLSLSLSSPSDKGPVTSSFHPFTASREILAVLSIGADVGPGGKAIMEGGGKVE